LTGHAEPRQPEMETTGQRANKQPEALFHSAKKKPSEGFTGLLEQEGAGLSRGVDGDAAAPNTQLASNSKVPVRAARHSRATKLREGDDVAMPR
jgi:hypothetical protein